MGVYVLNKVRESQENLDFNFLRLSPDSVELLCNPNQNRTICKSKGLTVGFPALKEEFFISLFV
jgi:hypothetical protein